LTVEFVLDLGLPVLLRGKIGTGEGIIAAIEVLDAEERVVLGLVYREGFMDLVN
jgi:hypothetical protein